MSFLGQRFKAPHNTTQHSIPSIPPGNGMKSFLLPVMREVGFQQKKDHIPHGRRPLKHIFDNL